MGFYRVFTLLNPGDPRSRPPRPRREESGREQSQRAPPFNPPCYEAPPPSYDSISTASVRSEGVRSNYDSHSATAGTNSGGLVAPSGPSSRPCSSHSSRRERPHSSYTSEVDRRFSQASFDKSRRSSRSEPDLSHELINDRRRSTTGIRPESNSRRQTRHESTNAYNQKSITYNHNTSEASHVSRSSEQPGATTGFATYDEWCTRSR
ncbi:hypothetical protein BofuT4_P132570.1 [Botrytis cinerea T4]|uniref:Uncharacterized protein n=1 Tax=Botryotinia fuckeliana (strain T4) TaxID=999810 RepID=G2YQ05_BOTF4|nr:hypothetical protein BofuT4_P132570.1 [Botrytis cinerea T4]